MQVVGICRFSLLGRGDWEVYQGVAETEIKEIAARQSALLFAPSRMESRLATFEHLTLASLQAQTDKDFIFLVLASEDMPEIYRQRLSDICSSVPQVILRFFPMIHVGDAQKAVFSELSLDLKEMLQFRLDDDDAVCTTFIQSKREIARLLAPRKLPFSLSFRSVMYCSIGGEFKGIYSWDSPFFSAGVALYHPTRSIFGFGHYALSWRFTSVILADGMSLATHNGHNDTQFNASRIRRQKFLKMDESAVAKTCAEQFPFLTAVGKELAGLPL
ncbi:hypothetical protein E4191_16185 (plasmid) [Paracoccus liaowanqingii]|uniref:Rhamnosyl transferase n=1 Tax=Paracoccus liaowanqingii TaxID=2560053 RepID=A0A4Y5SSD0_9RHOB|nr:glycosyltransferase [Paracoccus liaowanqingii]QDA35706.1 hypothetical protein E4191_16185 [Paracoccus liaowanqingii]